MFPLLEGLKQSAPSRGKRQLQSDAEPAAAPGHNALPEPIAARHQPFVRTMFVGFWLIAVGGFLALFYLGLVLASAPLTILGFLAAFAALYYLVQTWIELRGNEDIVCVTPEGYRDARLGALIPWAEMKALTRHAPGTRVYLFIDADRPERFMAQRGRLRRAAEAANRRRGFPLLTSDLSGLDQPGDRLVTAAETFFAAARRH